MSGIIKRNQLKYPVMKDIGIFVNALQATVVSLYSLNSNPFLPLKTFNKDSSARREEY